MPLFSQNDWTVREVKEAARLANAAYEDESAPSGWKKVSIMRLLEKAKVQAGNDITFSGLGVTNDKGEGFLQLLKSDDGRYALSFRGTDGLKDAQWWLGLASDKNGYVLSFEIAIEALGAAFKKLGISPSDLLITGHSLGGAAVNQFFNHAKYVAENAETAHQIQEARLWKSFVGANYIGFESPFISKWSDHDQVVNFGFSNDPIFMASHEPGDVRQGAVYTQNWNTIWTGKTKGTSWDRILDPHKNVKLIESLELLQSSGLYALEKYQGSDFADITEDSIVYFIRGEKHAANVPTGRDPFTPNYVFGRESVDLITGSKSSDIIDSFAGDDIVIGGKGSDVILGGAGDDLIYANTKQNYKARYNSSAIDDDSLYGGSGKDKLYGSSQYDLLMGNSGEDELFGGDGGDILNGGSGADRYLGGRGSDYFYFTAGDKIIDKATKSNLGEDILYVDMPSIVLEGQFHTVGKYIATIATKTINVRAYNFDDDDPIEIWSGEKSLKINISYRGNEGGDVQVELGKSQDKVAIGGIRTLDNEVGLTGVRISNFNGKVDKLDLSSAKIGRFFANQDAFREWCSQSETDVSRSVNAYRSGDNVCVTRGESEIFFVSMLSPSSLSGSDWLMM
ncbi:hypothetical protein MUO32_29080 [Shinella sp. CPCC 101442]|uniref:hypothetical protein n=1 Tax=Shinella sp. CPCC 101442 TaxID=2932265 RepID=UPI0021529286|nr:hypothetical protein [Shinella sp. CPCC 101442]MCR6503076.1 hypothetical protein [Shinella sp. CPCC 101442]